MAQSVRQTKEYHLTLKKMFTGLSSQRITIMCYFMWRAYNGDEHEILHNKVKSAGRPGRH